MIGILFLAAVIAAVAAVIFFAQARSSGAALLALKDEHTADRKATESDRTALRDAQAELKQRSQQLLELREKLSDQKKRVDSKTAKVQPRGVREAELEEDLAHARQLADEAHASEQDARRQAIAARTALQGKEAELARAQEKVRELSSRPAAPSAVQSDPQAAAQSNTALVSAQADARRSEEKVRETMARLTDAESQLAASRDREQRSRDEGKKAKGRAETNNRAFLISKGELELMKERLAQAERRLWQAGIALPKPAAPERPKATGPASADRVREEPHAGATATDTQTTASAATEPAPADSASADAANGSESAESHASAPMADSNDPQAVSPLRRRPAQSELPKS